MFITKENVMGDCLSVSLLNLDKRFGVKKFENQLVLS